VTRPFALPKTLRLRHARDFQRVYDLGLRSGDAYLLIIAAPGMSETTRFGLSVSRKHGGAVRRQRIKRLLREAFRLSRPELPGGLDLILIPRVAASATLDDYRRSLVELTRRLARRVTSARHGRSTTSG
jgi:ribonuclease P protein component